MDTIGRNLQGKILVYVLSVTVLLAVIVLLCIFYSRCMVGLCKKHVSISPLSSTSSGYQLHERPHNSIKECPIDTECETETTVLMIPQHASRMSQFHCENEIKEEDEILTNLYEKHGQGNRKINFYRLPKDRRDSYLKFKSVDDDLGELTDDLPIQTWNKLPFDNLKKDQDLYRKCSWDKKSLVQMMKMDKNGEIKYEVDDPKESIIQANVHRVCLLNQATTRINQETLI